jgi:hypothetical protein
MNPPAPIEGGGLLEPPSSMGPFPSRRPSASVEGGGGAWEVKRENGGGGLPWTTSVKEAGEALDG